MILELRANSRGRLEGLFGLRDRVAETLAIASSTVLLVNFGLILWFVIPRLGSMDFLRLHYTAKLGVDWVGPWWNILVFPGFAFATLLVNGLLAGLLAKERPLMAAVTYGMTAVLEILFLVGGIMAILLNG